MNDPMLSADSKERDDYKADVMDVLQKAIEEDRASRRAKNANDSPAVIIGAAGRTGGLSQSI